MIEILKTISVVVMAILAFMIPTLRAKNKALIEDVESLGEELVNLKENAKINKDASSATFPELSDGLLAKQKKRRSK